jgi:phospholipase C
VRRASLQIPVAYNPQRLRSGYRDPLHRDRAERIRQVGDYAQHAHSAGMRKSGREQHFLERDFWVPIFAPPLLEQQFLVGTINSIMSSPYWKSTAIVILYDDSDGWYDHQMPPIVNPSAVNTGVVNDSDQLNGPGVCGHGTPLAGIEGRCGYGPRLPLVLISPFARANFVDHTLTDQSSVLRFIEDNWGTGQIGGGSFDQIAGSLLNMFDFKHHGDDGDRRLILDPTTGQPVNSNGSW